MSEDRIYMIFADKRSFEVEAEIREEATYREPRAFEVQDEERMLEVRLP